MERKGAPIPPRPPAERPHEAEPKAVGHVPWQAVYSGKNPGKFNVMKDFNAIAKLPEVVGAVLSDPSGSLLDWSGDVDGEVAGAVHSFSVRSLTRAGELLGLGAFLRASIVGPTKTCVITLQGDTILGTYVDPSKPVAAIEKKLQDTLQK